MKNKLFSFQSTCIDGPRFIRAFIRLALFLLMGFMAHAQAQVTFEAVAATPTNGTVAVRGGTLNAPRYTQV